MCQWCSDGAVMVQCSVGAVTVLYCTQCRGYRLVVEVGGEMLEVTGLSLEVTGLRLEVRD